MVSQGHVEGVAASLAQPVLEGLGDELGTIVAPDEIREEASDRSQEASLTGASRHGGHEFLALRTGPIAAEGSGS
jgi:hypothetical protein